MEPSQPGQSIEPINRDRILFWACMYLRISQRKINMAAVSMSKFKWTNHLCKQLIGRRKLIRYFSFFESANIKSQEEETNRFSYQTLKNGILKVNYVKPI